MPTADKRDHVCEPVKVFKFAQQKYELEDIKKGKREAIVDKDKEITVADTQATDMTQLPKRVIEDAQLAAKQLTEIVSKKPKKVVINGEQYLEFEDWQTLGRFYGLFVKTSNPEFVEIDGVKGFKAQAKVVSRTGIELGSATAFCFRDEKNWISKPVFQLASMAQTRAGAKALRNLLAWVAVLAGYKPTPAEEIIETNGKTEEHTEAIAPEALLCTGCNKAITEKVYKYSQEKFNKPLCFECQKKCGKTYEKSRVRNS
jgi:hypothetical protein